MPGRLVGVTVDAQGNAGLPPRAADARAAHPPREGDLQHLHRAGAAGGDGLDVRGVPRPARARAHRPARAPPDRASSGRARASSASRSTTRDFFDTLTVATGERTQAIVERARAARVNLRRVDAARLGISLDETTTREDVEALWRLFAGRPVAFDAAELDRGPPRRFPPRSRAPRPTSRTRCSTATTPRPRCCATCAGSPTRTWRSTASMIPLGSCTMKLNATSEMIPVTWPEFAHIHPFAPAEQGEGYRELIEDLEQLPRASDRLRRGVAAAQRRLAGRVRGAARHPRLAREPRRGPPQRLPDPELGARHQSGLGAHGRACRWWSWPATSDGNVDLADLERQGRGSTRATSPRSW